MEYVVETARNGEQTLRVNGRYIYSKYSPSKEVKAWIEREFDDTATSYVLIGLGLGYHLDELMKINMNKRIQVLALLSEEPSQFSTYENVEIVYSFADLHLDEGIQILLPLAWLQVLGEDHPLYESLADIKRKQISFKLCSEKMGQNFKSNVSLNEFHLLEYKEHIQNEKVACLISSGPTLNETAHYLKDVRAKVYILCVGSALKVLLNKGIVPDAVIISDCQDQIYTQLENTMFQGTLFYLSTANEHTVRDYEGERCILLQSGYRLAEVEAEIHNYPLLLTGGSVATTAYSLLHYLSFDTIVLFGQDLTVANSTHAEGSTSNRTIVKNETLLKVLANNGQYVSTLPNLMSYKRWFDQIVVKHNRKTFTTSWTGCKLNGVSYINEYDFLKLTEKNT